MNREIKFRAWDSLQNKMYEWHELIEQDIKGRLTLSNLLNGFIKHIKPLQFTGLKDKNGKEIYEKDSLRCTHPNDEFTHVGIVEYDNELACFLLNRGRNLTHIYLYELDSYEVIGDIYN